MTFQEKIKWPASGASQVLWGLTRAPLGKSMGNFMNESLETKISTDLYHWTELKCELGSAQSRNMAWLSVFGFSWPAESMPSSQPFVNCALQSLPPTYQTGHPAAPYICDPADWAGMLPEYTLYFSSRCLCLYHSVLQACFVSSMPPRSLTILQAPTKMISPRNLRGSPCPPTPPYTAHTCAPTFIPPSVDICIPFTDYLLETVSHWWINSTSVESFLLDRKLLGGGYLGGPLHLICFCSAHTANTG